MSALSTSSVPARLDRLPGCWPVWRLVLLLSLGGCFEFYDLFLTAYLSPGLEAAGIFRKGAKGLLGLSDQAMFAAVTFAGLFVGTFVLARIADRYGRRAIFTGSLLWYSVMTLGMSAQDSAVGLDFWRFLAGIGIGVELVTIDAYITELVPGRLRGRAFAVNQAVQFLAVPVVALLCAMLVPRTALGIPGWRWVIVLGAAGALAAWALRRGLPESPRWLASRGRDAEAGAIVTQLEERIYAQTGVALAPPTPLSPATPVTTGLRAIFRPPLLSITVMLAVFNFFQTVGFYGFGNWVPKLIEAGGTDVLHSARYAAAIAIAYPVGPLLCTLIADRWERKWQIVGAALGTATFGLLFMRQREPYALITLGVAITLSNNLLSYAYHAYQAELYPTQIRARAVGFVYSWSRLSTVFTSLMIGYVLDRFGTAGVFTFIAASMGVVCLSIGAFGPRTRNLALESVLQAGDPVRR